MMDAILYWVVCEGTPQGKQKAIMQCIHWNDFLT